MMIRESREHSLPEPSFGGNQPGEFGATVWRDWLTEEVMAELGLNDRQKKGLAFLKLNGTITNREYQSEAGAIARTSTRDLKKLVEIGLLQQVGTTGRNTRYILSRKRDINETTQR